MAPDQRAHRGCRHKSGAIETFEGAIELPLDDQELFDETPITETASADDATPALFGLALTHAEVAAISALERGRMKGRDPLTHEEM